MGAGLGVSVDVGGGVGAVVSVNVRLTWCLAAWATVARPVFPPKRYSCIASRSEQVAWLLAKSAHGGIEATRE